MSRWGAALGLPQHHPLGILLDRYGPGNVPERAIEGVCLVLGWSRWDYLAAAVSGTIPEGRP